MIFTRRSFLQSGSLATASLMLPKFLKAFEPGNYKVEKGNKVLIVLQFSGGNDGLNTIIPVTQDEYFRSRPNLHIPAAVAHKLTINAGLHPALTYFKELYDQGELAIMNDVGYESPDRSHFRSMDIWQSASESNEYLTSGWLGRYLDEQCKNCDLPTQALEIDDVLSLLLKGNDQRGLALRNPKDLYSSNSRKFFKSLSHAHVHGEETVDYLYKTMTDTINSADYIYEQSKVHNSTAVYPASKTGRSLKTIASLVLSDINTKVYYLSLGSFDTHAGQAFKQNKLFEELNEAISAFVKDMKHNNRFDDVMIMTFSEFGRRVAENASRGTDHGTANNMFFISGALKQKGLLNDIPNLSHTSRGDLIHKVDFKSVYATVLKKWLNADDQLILGKQFPTFDFI